MVTMCRKTIEMSDNEIQELRRQVELLTIQLDPQNVSNKSGELSPGYSSDEADILSSSCGVILVCQIR